MDIGISRNWYDSFIRYQRRLRVEFKKLQEKYGFEIVDANRPVNAIQKGLRVRVESVLHTERSAI
jgi:dTMP kinase